MKIFMGLVEDELSELASEFVHGDVEVEVIRQRYDCWMHIHDLGQDLCSYCQHVRDKDD